MYFMYIDGKLEALFLRADKVLRAAKAETRAHSRNELVVDAFGDVIYYCR